MDVEIKNYTKFKFTTRQRLLSQYFIYKKVFISVVSSVSKTGRKILFYFK